VLTLNGECTALWRAWKRRDQNYLAVARECRAIGIHWKNCKALIRAKRNAGEHITVAAWAKAHAPVSDRWLDKYAEFSSRWDEFQAAWKWVQMQPYTPDRRPGLHSFFDLMQSHVIDRRYARARAAVARRPTGFQNSVRETRSATNPTVEVLDLTPTTRVIVGGLSSPCKCIPPMGRPTSSSRMSPTSSAATMI
jgi:hypothetical protein